MPKLTVENISPLVDTSLLSRRSHEQRVVSTAHRLYEHLIALWAPALIEAAHDLGVFTALAQAPSSSAELASALHTDPRATRILLDALYAYDILGRISDAECKTTYVLPDEARECLLPGGLFSLVGKIVYDRKVAWNAWWHLADSVRIGAHDTAGLDQRNQISLGDYESLVGGINFWAPPIVETLCDRLHQLGLVGREQGSVLDVGCGTGLYSQLLLQRLPSWRAVGFDAEPITRLAVQQSQRLGVESRFVPTACDFWEHNWGDGFDMVLFANIFHLQTKESADRLTVLAANALAENGVVAIVDHIVDADRPATSPQDRFALLFAASMTTTGGGDAYTLQDYDEWFDHSGLKRIQVLETPMHRILLAGHTSGSSSKSRRGDHLLSCRWSDAEECEDLV